MMKFRLSEVALWTHGRLHGADVEVSGVATDSRTPMPGALFVALKGENFDAHEFVAAAQAAGAVAALVTRPVEIDLPQVVVADTLLALGDLASAVRAQRHARVVGITGSNGKTTVKTLLASILALHGRTHVNAGNFNNEIGLPISLLALPEEAEYAVLEMGAGKPGDIAYLAAIARPEVGLVNNIAAAHLERMGSLEGIAETKGALYAALPSHGTAVINAEDAFASTFAAMSRAQHTLRYGLAHTDPDVAGEILRLGATTRFALRIGDERGDIELSLPGRHNVMNALAAAALAHALGVPFATIKRGLEGATAVKGRLVRHAMSGGWTLIDDSYNANPGSTAAAIEILAQLALESGGESWLVLGDMRELGAGGAQMHAECGALAKRRGIARLFTVGELSREASLAFGDGAEHFVDQQSLSAALAARARAGINVLVKGSRGSAMDRVVRAMLDGVGSNGGGERHAA
jgi:UDP-N-acetylmuramoyl-tripeptide--D-alanyl-D-alanine ligase